MKRAKSQVIGAPFLQRDELLDDVNNLCCIEYPFYRWPVDHMVKILKRHKGAKVQRCKGRSQVSGIRRQEEGWSTKQDPLPGGDWGGLRKVLMSKTQILQARHKDSKRSEQDFSYIYCRFLPYEKLLT